MAQSWKIGDMARLTGLSVRTLHHYDQIGLLGASERTESGHRMYAEADLEHAIGLMRRHKTLEDTIERARHYGAMAKDALALFADSPMKSALVDVVEFCIGRAH